MLRVPLDHVLCREAYLMVGFRAQDLVGDGLQNVSSREGLAALGYLGDLPSLIPAKY